MRFDFDETFIPRVHALRDHFPEWRWTAHVEKYSWLYIGVLGERHAIVYSLVSRYFDDDHRKRRWYVRENGQRPLPFWQWAAGARD